MNCDLETSIPEWIIDHPETMTVFNHFELDTSCAGKSLEYVCQQQDLDPADVLGQLREAITRRGDQAVACPRPRLPAVPPRLTSGPLPAYAYVPGMHPRPSSDAQGDSRGQTPEAVDPSDEVAVWKLHCRAVDLLNAGFYWESHEVWESLWIAEGRRGPQANFVKGLIKLAAAGVKARQGSLSGVKRHARRAAALFHHCAEDADQQDHQTLGLSAQRLHQKSLQTLHQASAIVDSTPCAVRRVLPLVLLPMRRT